jgi:hypothetical protein
MESIGGAAESGSVESAVASAGNTVSSDGVMGAGRGGWAVAAGTHRHVAASAA